MIYKITIGLIVSFMLIISASFTIVHDNQIKKLDYRLTYLEKKFEKINQIQDNIIDVVNEVIYAVDDLERKAQEDLIKEETTIAQGL